MNPLSHMQQDEQDYIYMRCIQDLHDAKEKEAEEKKPTPPVPKEPLPEKKDNP